MESMKNKPFIYEMVKQAERNMFEAKRSYHEDTGDIQNIRGMNRKLEKTLMEKGIWTFSGRFFPPNIWVFILWI